MKKKTPRKGKKWLRLLAQGLSIPIILYALIFIIGYAISWVQTGQADPYAVESYPFIENLPPIFLAAAISGLAIAWKDEKVGALINIIFSIATLPILLIHWPISQDIHFIIPYILLLIVVLPGILFLYHHLISQK